MKSSITHFRIIFSMLLFLQFDSGLCKNKKEYDPTTLVFPPYLHTYGIRKATKYHLFLFMQNRVKFNDPQGLAVVRLISWEDSTKKGDNDEVTVYGVNSGQHNIIFNTSMTSLGVYGLNEKGEQKLTNPHGITANARGDVYVADTGNNRIVRLFNPQKSLNYVSSIGKLGSNPGEFKQPRGVALNSDGTIYVADTGNHRIQIIDKQDEFVFKFGSFGRENGQLYYPAAIAVVDKKTPWSFYRESFIVVVDLNFSRIQKFNLNGEFIKSVALKDFNYPETELVYLALDYFNNIYTTDIKNHCIHKFDHNLNYLTSFGRKGTGDKEFIEPRGITIYRRFGQIFVAEKEGAQYYWMGTDFKDFKVRKDESRKNYFIFEYTLTETSFITADVFTEKEKFVTRIFNKRFQSPGSQQDNWGGYIRHWSEKVLQCENLSMPPEFKNLKNLPPGNYKIRYRFEPTYSSYHFFQKEITETIKIE